MSDEPDIDLQHDYFDKACNDLSGKPFQAWFERIMKRLDPDFIPIGHEGRQGDHGCDGFSISTGIFFQVYAPKTLKEDLRKTERDFKRALKKWGERIKEWVFVHGKTEVKPTIAQLVYDLAEKNNIKITPWSNVDLWKAFLELPRDERIDLLGLPPHYKDEPMRRIYETHDIVLDIHEKIVGGQEPASIEADDEIVALSKKVVKNFDDIHSLPDNKKKQILHFIVSTSENARELGDSFRRLSEIFPNDFGLVTSVINRIPFWSDQIVENALHQFLIKSTDNRVPDVIYEVAADPKRDQGGPSKPFRNVYFGLLGKHGRRDHIRKLIELRERERNGRIRMYIDRTIEYLRGRFPEPENMMTESLKIRFHGELESIRNKLGGGNYPMIDTIPLTQLIDNPSFQNLPTKTQEEITLIGIALREHNTLRMKANPWLRMRTPGESYPIPTKYVGDVVIRFINDLEEVCQRIIGVIDEVLNRF